MRVQIEEAGRNFYHFLTNYKIISPIFFYFQGRNNLKIKIYQRYSKI